MKKYSKPIILAAAGALLLSGCVYRERTVYSEPGPNGTVVASDTVVAEPPPPPIVEVQPVMPGPGFVWIGGAWYWGGHRWDWQPGHWAHPPRPGAVWVPHRYVYRNGQHVFIRGGWR